MSMIDTNERLRHAEMLREEEPLEAPSGARLTRARADQMSARRAEMLAAVRGSVTPALYDALRAKVDYERAALFALVERCAHAAKERERRHAELKAEYFTKRPLDADLL